MILLSLALASVSGPARFTCTAGGKQIEVVSSGETLTYRYGPRGRPEITLTGSPAGGVFYHREMYPRGEDQTLRFVQGPWSYVVFDRWQAGRQFSRHVIEHGYDKSGLLVMHDGRIVRRIDCGDDATDLVEWEIFFRLPQDADNLAPQD